jgi:hypothetical protein
MGTRYCIPSLVAIDEEMNEKFEVTEVGARPKIAAVGATSHGTRHQPPESSSFGGRVNNSMALAAHV